MKSIMCMKSEHVCVCVCVCERDIIDSTPHIVVTGMESFSHLELMAGH